MRDALMCPFCRAELPLPSRSRIAELCGGKFTDTDHPSAVRPILVELEDDGSLRPGQEERLARSRATYA
jgi:hypothetical protein